MKGLEVLLTEQEVRKELLYRLVNPDLRKLSDLYKQHGHELRIVGGAVRDILMNKKPKDIDLASDALPDESLGMLQNAGIHTIETGLQHGTITAHIDGEDYEITTLRVDVETDGRHAEVEFTNDWRLDAERRDLTFNAMSLDFDGNLYDYFGGYEDLQNGVARFVGDASDRMEEDYLRILRYFRFQGRMAVPDFDTKTLQAIKKNAPGLKNISGERIWMEMSKILAGKYAYGIVNAMEETGVLENIGLERTDFLGLGNVVGVTNDPVLRLTAMIEDENMLNTLYGYWKFPKNQKLLMEFILSNRDTEVNLSSAKKIHAQFGVQKHFIAKLLEYQGQQEALREFLRWQLPKFPVNGDDLITMGMKPGEEIGLTLSQLKKEWAESDYTLTKDQLLKTL
jgi:tRNA nucleotidyltransferase (CCA-adding enzyme)